MKTGYLLTDGSGRAWTIGQLLGRGTWGKTWAARDDTGREGAIKEPFGLTDLPADLAGAEGLVEICREIAEQTADWLEKATSPAAPRLEGRLKIPGVGTAVITPRYPTSLGRKLDAGNSLDESLDLLCRVVVRLTEMPRPHGNLRASNIFLSERGYVVLGDPLVPALAAAWG
nr:hypothetical protein [Deltaproteobacteria bacterium]